jgi:hypothetical protein
MRPYLDWQENGTTLPDSVRDGDRAALVAIVSEYEGAESAHWLQFWLDRQPESFVVYRDSSGEPAGFVVVVNLAEASAEDRAADPAIRAAWTYLERRAQLRPGEKAIHFRFWMARESYQAVSGLQSLIFGRAAQVYLSTPGLAFSFFSAAESDFWSPMFAHVDIPRLPDADYQIDGRNFGVFGHDWRVTSPFAWLELLGDREIAVESQRVAPTEINSAIVLSEPDFTEAVRLAVRDVARPVALRDNPLLRSRLVIERAGASSRSGDRVSTLQTVVGEAVAALEKSPRDAKLYRAFHHTYIEPAPSQEMAAEILNLPFSTYRRHLAAALARVIRYLWEQEIGNRDD